jgi:hypothetical protein
MTCKFIALGYGYRSLWLIALAFDCKAFAQELSSMKKVKIHIKKIDSRVSEMRAIIRQSCGICGC